MSIIQAMFAGSSALTNFGEAMTVIGNNLANANTTAFKASSSSFEDVLIQTVGNRGNGASTQIGTGVGLASVRQSMAQGSFSSTSNVTDLSIDGRGFFQVRDQTIAAADPLDQTGRPKDLFYTRAGGFTKNDSHQLVSSGGMVLQGWKLDDTGKHIGNPGDIDLKNYFVSGVDPTPTSLVNLGVNLDSTTKIKDQPYKPDDSATFDYETSVRVFDSNGVGHNVRIQFRKEPMQVPATYNPNGTSTSIKVDVGLTDALKAATPAEDKVTITLTPVNGGTAIKADPVTVTSGANSIDVSKLTSGGAPIVLPASTRYKIDYALEGKSKMLNVIGNDGVPEVQGEGNDGTWKWHLVVPNKELDLSQRSATSDSFTALDLDPKNLTSGPTGADYTQGKLVFDNKGKLVNEGSVPITVKFLGADAQQILFDFGDAVSKYGDSTNDFSNKTTLSKKYEATLASDISNTGGAGCHQSTGPFSLLRLEQDGFTSGTLDKLAIGKDGIVSGNFTNGQTKDLYQVTLYDFDDEYSLEQVGSNLFNETNASGKARPNNPGSGRLGDIISFSLEQSNVDMSSEFVRMITTQRGFQANSRIVTVTDGMLEELLALKR